MLPNKCLFVLLISLSCLISQTLGQATVELIDYWGTLTLNAGKHMEYHNHNVSGCVRKEIYIMSRNLLGETADIPCQASNAAPDGSFLWTVDGIPLPESESKEEIEANQFKQIYSFQPEIQYDGKTLKCK